MAIFGNKKKKQKNEEASGTETPTLNEEASQADAENAGAEITENADDTQNQDAEIKALRRNWLNKTRGAPVEARSNGIFNTKTGEKLIAKRFTEEDVEAFNNPAN